IANDTLGLVPLRQKASDYDNPDPVPQRKDVSSSADADVPSQQELDLLFGPLYNEFFNAGSNPSTNIQSTSAPSTHTNMPAEENNNDQAEEGEQLQDNEFTNPFCASTQEVAESSSHNLEVFETSVANNTSGLVPQRQKASDYDNPDPVPQRKDVSSLVDADVPSQQEFDLLFGPLYDEFFNAGSNPQDKQPLTNIPSTSAPSTHTNVHAEENNNDQAEKGEQLQDDKFTNPFCAPTQDVAESSSYNIEQVRGNPSRPVQTRRKLATDPEMCMYALTVSTAEPKNIKEVMADSAWIEVMQEEVHQFDRLQVWELADKQFGKMVIRLKWLWKNKKDEDQTVIRNKARLVAKEYAQEEGLQIHQSPSGIFINQAKYTLEILHKNGMDKDADHAGCIDSHESTSGGIQFLGDKLVIWMSKKQNCTAMLSAEAEYVALSASCAQVMWMRTQLQDYGFNYNKIPLYYDSQSAIVISCNLVQHSRTKHIHTRRIGMRCSTPAELEVLAKESA
nr:uncharacterized mitochondrial protein AtMg00810-like [Tanacetum cinerariifolium]